MSQYGQQPWPGNPPQRPSYPQPRPQGAPLPPPQQGAVPPRQAYQPQASGSGPEQPVKRRKVWPIVVGIIVGLLVCIVAGWAIYFYGPAAKSDPLERQWAKLQHEVPNGEAFILEWRETNHPSGRPGKIDSLDAYWIDGTNLQYRSTSKESENRPNSRLDNRLDGHANQKITADDIATYQKYIDAVSCEGDDYRNARMVKLPDGTPMFFTACGGWNNWLDPGTKFGIDGKIFDRKDLNSLIEGSNIAFSHLEKPLAKLRLYGGGVYADTCLAEGLDPTQFCLTRIKFTKIEPWPVVENRAGLPADHTTWPETVSKYVPEGIPSGPVTADMIDQYKLAARLAQLKQAGIDPTSAKHRVCFVKYKESFAIALISGGQFVLMDADGNQLNR